jgi:gluconate kinase
MIRAYIGISASGKTTLCKGDMKLNTNSVRVNRDDLRFAVYGLDYDSYGDYFKRDDFYRCEQFISDLADRIVSRAISKGKDVYIDNTHLKQKYLKKYYTYGVDVELVWCDVDIDLALHRNVNRKDHFVDSEIIKKQNDSYEIIKKNWKSPDEVAERKIHNNSLKKKCYVFDIDGTLADKGDRNPYDYSRVSEDGLRNSVLDAYLAHSFDGKEMIICSGRDSSCRTETEDWLTKNQVYYTTLYMRQEGDSRADWKVKEEMWDEICKDYYIVAMYDDRNQVVDHARSLGFDVFQVQEGNF